ncbi:MAG TPA: hypothetical protein VIQ30_13950 [Pseudonocardia sp.]
MIPHASSEMTSHEAPYRFEPAATFFYEDLFAPAEQPPSRLDALRARLSRKLVGGPVGSRR